MDSETEINMDENTPLKLKGRSMTYESINPLNAGLDLMVEGSDDNTQRNTLNIDDFFKPKYDKEPTIKKSFSQKYVIPNIGITIFALSSIAMILIFKFVAKWNLNWQGWYTVTLLFIVLGMLLKNVAPPEFVMLGALVTLVLPQIITPAQSLAGFGNDAIVTIGILFVVSKGIENTNALEILLRSILGNPKGMTIAILRMMIPVIVCSAFMNNTPVVCMMIPVVQGWSKRNKLNDRKLLMPLSWASILGGTCTLIGTSTNLIVYGFAQLDDPNFTLNIFEIAKAGAPLAVVGMIYVIIFHRFVMNDDGVVTFEKKKEEEKEYIISFNVKGRRFIGKKIESTGLMEIGGLEFHSSIVGDKIYNPSPDTIIEGDKIFNFKGSVHKFQEIIFSDGIDLKDELKFALLKKQGDPIFVEAVVGPKSKLIGYTPNKINFVYVFNAVIISIYRPSENIYRKVDDTSIEEGDCLLLRTSTLFVDNYKSDPQFSLVSKVEDFEVPLKDKKRMILALLIVVAMIAVTSTGYVSLLGTSLVAALLMLAFDCLTAEQAWKAVRGNLLMIIAAAFALGIAMDVTGTAKEIAKTLVDIFRPVGEIGILLGLFYATSILTSVISNGATVSVMYF